MKTKAEQKLHDLEKKIAAQFRAGDRTISEEQKSERESLKKSIDLEKTKKLFSK